MMKKVARQKAGDALIKMAESLEDLANRIEKSQVKTAVRASGNVTYGDYGSIGQNRGYGTDPLTAFLLGS